MLANSIVILIIAVLVAGASVKMIIDKRNGVQCPGCPYSRVGKERCRCSHLPSNEPASKR